MSELDEKIWAVISERGVEASELTSTAAVNLRRTLKAEKIHGLCVVTNAAARREEEQDSRHRSQESLVSTGSSSDRA